MTARKTRKLLSIGFSSEYQERLQQLLLFVPPEYPYDLHYEGEVKVASAVAALSEPRSETVVLLDFEAKVGRMAWNTLSAYHLNASIVVVSKQPASIRHEFSLSKPLQPTVLFSVLETLSLLNAAALPADDRISMMVAA